MRVLFPTSGFLAMAVCLATAAAQGPVQAIKPSSANISSDSTSGRIDPAAVQTNTRSVKLWVRLRNNDRITARLHPQEVTLKTATGTETLRTEQIVSMRGDGKAPDQFTVTLANGGTAEGEFQDQAITLELEVGAALTLPIVAIAAMGNAGTQETDVRRRLGAEPTDSAIRDFKAPDGFVWVPPGEFLMGSSTEDVGRDLDEGPQTKVIIPQGFWIARTEVTQAEYLRVMETNPSLNTGAADRPVERVTWYDAIQYCARLTRRAQAQQGLPPNFAYRLPTEAEWEYACRGGTTSRFSFGDDKEESELPQYAWFTRNSDSMTHPVGKKQPNALGLLDMHGNVWEWCLDWWGSALPGGSVTNRPVSAGGALRAARGGSWLYEARACRSANRDDYGASNRCGDLGFRIVLQATAPTED